MWGVVWWREVLEFALLAANDSHNDPARVHVHSYRAAATAADIGSSDLDGLLIENSFDRCNVSLSNVICHLVIQRAQTRTADDSHCHTHIVGSLLTHLVKKSRNSDVGELGAGVLTGVAAWKDNMGNAADLGKGAMGTYGHTGS